MGLQAKIFCGVPVYRNDLIEKCVTKFMDPSEI